MDNYEIWEFDSHLFNKKIKINPTRRGASHINLLPNCVIIFNKRLKTLILIDEIIKASTLITIVKSKNFIPRHKIDNLFVVNTMCTVSVSKFETQISNLKLDGFDPVYLKTRSRYHYYIFSFSFSFHVPLQKNHELSCKILYEKCLGDIIVDIKLIPYRYIS
jgi:hypothetical protein